MPLPQDMLSRIINVNWPGGTFIVVWIGGFKSTFGAGPQPDPALNIDVKSDYPWFGWTGMGKPLESSTLTEKTRTDAHKVLFDTPPGKLEDYAHFQEIGAETNVQDFTVIDRARYHVQNQHTGVVVTSLISEFDGTLIPFTFDYTGDDTPDPPHDLFLSPPADLFTIAAAQSLSLPGVGWLPVLNTILASHVESTTTHRKVLNRNRFLFINYSKLKAEHPEDASVWVDIAASFAGGTAEQQYGLFCVAGVYPKQVQDGNNIYTENQPVAADDVWPRVEGEDVLDPEGDFANGGPAYFPPNDDFLDHTRFPYEGDDTFVVHAIASGESTIPPGKIRLTIGLGDEPTITAETIYAFPP